MGVVLLASLVGHSLRAQHEHANRATHDGVKFGGHLELRAIHYWLDPDEAAYQMGYAGLAQRESIDRTTATLKLNSAARGGAWRFASRLHFDWDRD